MRVSSKTQRGTFTGLCAGTNYVITGTDANGCTGTTNITLSTPNAPTASVSNITNVSCNGLCDGTAQAGAVGGTGLYFCDYCSRCDRHQHRCYHRIMCWYLHRDGDRCQQL
ncbi:MAG: hypothetical protein IPF62_14445 [Bacteroidetes bacterium]|nr:hypothetical protein [Bacteroidota bacterium]